MSNNAEEEILKKFMLDKFRLYREDTDEHLAKCPDAKVGEIRREEDSCSLHEDCPIAILTTEVSCPHEQEEFHYSEYKDIPALVQSIVSNQRAWTA